MVAEALRDWLPCVIQAAEPWMSESDIAPGDRWSVSLADQLKDAHFGIICLTPENLKAPWIHFEAGALSKVIGKSHVCPYLFDLDTENMEYPLAQFQAIKSDEDGTKRLIQTVNNALDSDTQISSEQLGKISAKWWPDLDGKLKEIPSDFRDAEPPKREIDDMFREIMELIRSQSDKLSKIHFELQSKGTSSKLTKNLVDRLSQNFPNSPDSLSPIVGKAVDETHKDFSNINYQLLANSVFKNLQENGVEVENDEIIIRLKLLIDNFTVPPDEAARSVVNYFLTEHYRENV